MKREEFIKEVWKDIKSYALKKATLETLEIYIKNRRKKGVGVGATS